MQTVHEAGAALPDVIQPNRLYLTRHCAALLGHSHRTLEGWRRLGMGPQTTRLPGGAVRYRGKHILEFIEAAAVTSG